MSEKIEIKIQTEKRMTAITNLAIAIREVAHALTSVPQVNISSCVFNASDIGINIEKLDEEDTETIPVKSGEK